MAQIMTVPPFLRLSPQRPTGCQKRHVRYEKIMENKGDEKRDHVKNCLKKWYQCVVIRASRWRGTLITPVY